MVKIYLIILIFILSPLAMAKNKNSYRGIFYFKEIFGHLHEKSLVSSTTLTTIACGHPVKVYAKQVAHSKWLKVRVAAYDGFIEKKSLSSSKVKCFQDKYPRFFDSLKVEISDIYYWGMLQDQYIVGKTRVQ